MRWNWKLATCVRSTALHISADPSEDERLLGEWQRIMSVCLDDWSHVSGREPFLAERALLPEGLDEDEELDYRVEVEVETM